jgi:hypothetical protein
MVTDVVCDYYPTRVWSDGDGHERAHTLFSRFSGYSRAELETYVAWLVRAQDVSRSVNRS